MYSRDGIKEKYPSKKSETLDVNDASINQEKLSKLRKTRIKPTYEILAKRQEDLKVNPQPICR